MLFIICISLKNIFLVYKNVFFSKKKKKYSSIENKYFDRMEIYENDKKYKIMKKKIAKTPENYDEIKMEYFILTTR
jgi:hypothetical protein